MRFSALLSAAVVAVFITGCKSKAFYDCVDRGIESHKQMGSYPKMKSLAFAGQDAKEIIESRCLRSVSAY